MDWQEKAEHPNLTEFENQVLSIRKSIGIRVFKEILKDEESEIPAECKASMQPKGKRQQRIKTRLGTLELEREYFYGKTCRDESIWRILKQRVAVNSTRLVDALKEAYLVFFEENLAEDLLQFAGLTL